MIDNHTQAFFSLLKAGLWERDVRLSQYKEIDFVKVYRLAEEQAVVGLVTAGIDRIIDIKVPQKEVLQFVGTSLHLEQRNQAMNSFIAEMVERMRTVGIYTLLVKGQGIAQCYERPQWRTSGDIDFFLSDENYRKAETYLKPKASYVGGINPYTRHVAMTIDSWNVELHGSLRNGLWKSMDRTMNEVQYDIFCGGNVRLWQDGETHISLPRADEDVVYVFSHILEHFYKEGIGLRQICDWCRLLWTFRNNINLNVLESRLRKMQVMTEWKAFAALAVEWLGMPSDVMPLYSQEGHWSRKANRIIRFVIETGNFGHNRDYSYQQKCSFLVSKAISLWWHIIDSFKYLCIFPLDSTKVLWMRLVVGFTVILKGKVWINHTGCK